MRTIETVGLGLLLASVLPAQEQSAFQWRDDLPAAEREAARTGKPLLLAFR